VTPYEKTLGSHSAAGFAIGITLAVVSFWLAGMVVELRSYAVDGSQLTGMTSTSCPVGADDPVQCPPLPASDR
jgi:hypothetical protein